MLYFLFKYVWICITNIVCVVICIEDTITFFSNIWEDIIEDEEEDGSKETSLRYSLFSNFLWITLLGFYYNDLFPVLKVGFEPGY